MDNTTVMIYKRNKICLGCKRNYGTDTKSDDGYCPICVKKQGNGKRSRFERLGK